MIENEGALRRVVVRQALEITSLRDRLDGLRKVQEEAGKAYANLRKETSAVRNVSLERMNEIERLRARLSLTTGVATGAVAAEQVSDLARRGEEDCQSMREQVARAAESRDELARAIAAATGGEVGPRNSDLVEAVGEMRDTLNKLHRDNSRLKDVVRDGIRRLRRLLCLRDKSGTMSLQECVDRTESMVDTLRRSMRD